MEGLAEVTEGGEVDEGDGYDFNIRGVRVTLRKSEDVLDCFFIQNHSL